MCSVPTYAVPAELSVPLKLPRSPECPGPPTHVAVSVLRSELACSFHAGAVGASTLNHEPVRSGGVAASASAASSAAAVSTAAAAAAARAMHEVSVKSDRPGRD